MAETMLRNGNEVAGAAGATACELALLPGEGWWGGRIVDGSRMPYGAERPGRIALRPENDDESNQAQSLLVSSAGRYVWCEDLFAGEVRDGVLRLRGEGRPFVTGTGGATLAEAYRAASVRFFPADGHQPAELLFTRPQYNTWIELLYEQTEEAILRYARTLVREGYPPGVLMIDDNWQEDYGVWRFSSRRFSDPAAMMAELRSMGFAVMLWVCPFVSADSATARDLAARGYLLGERVRGGPVRPAMIRWWNGASAVLDLSNPGAVAWYRARLDTLVEEYGVAGFKFDAGDTHFYVAPEGSEYVSHAPRTPEGHTEDFARIGRHYPYNEYRAAWQCGGWALAQRLRDKDHSWEAVRELVPGVITQGLMGYPFACPDMIAGGLAGAFTDPTRFDPEIVVRSAQVHALMPMMQFSVAPWRVLSPELAAHCLAAARLHAEFAPRILALARNAAATGEPIVRPLEWRWPNRGYAAVQDQFMLGDEVMVAPVVHRGARERSVIFPPGRWRGDDGSVVEGPAERAISAPLARLPYYESIS